MVQQNVADFVNPQDLVNFHWLHDWWDPVQNKPGNLPTPTIMQFCWFVNHAPGTQPITFDMALKQFYEKAVQHCKQNGIDPANTSESAEERRKRRNRERMAEVRGHLRVPDKILKQQDEALAAQVRAFEAQCEQLKAEAKAADERLRIAVTEFQTAMIEASTHRKTVASDFKSRIESIRNEIQKLMQKT
jgi:hypothetical protein